MEESGIRERGELSVQARKLACIFLDRIEQGVRDGSLDQSQMRMLGILALRSLRLWKETLGKLESMAGNSSAANPVLAPEPAEDQKRSV